MDIYRRVAALETGRGSMPSTGSLVQRAAEPGPDIYQRGNAVMTARWGFGELSLCLQPLVEGSCSDASALGR